MARAPIPPRTDSRHAHAFSLHREHRLAPPAEAAGVPVAQQTCSESTMVWDWPAHATHCTHAPSWSRLVVLPLAHTTGEEHQRRIQPRVGHRSPPFCFTFATEPRHSRRIITAVAPLCRWVCAGGDGRAGRPLGGRTTRAAFHVLDPPTAGAVGRGDHRSESNGPVSQSFDSPGLRPARVAPFVHRRQACPAHAPGPASPPPPPGGGAQVRWATLWVQSPQPFRTGHHHRSSTVVHSHTHRQPSPHRPLWRVFRSHSGVGPRPSHAARRPGQPRPAAGGPL